VVFNNDESAAAATRHRLERRGAEQWRVATASSTYSSGYPVTAVNDGDRKGLNWGTGGGWNDATANAFPDSVHIAFSGLKTVTEIDVFTLKDAFTSPVDPTASMTFSAYGITAFDVQYWTGSAWSTVPGGSITGNRQVWTRLTFPALAPIASASSSTALWLRTPASSKSRPGGN
jgi:hypothetical protein